MGNRENDINIRVNTPGAAEAKQQLDKTAEGIRNVGATVQGTAPKVEVVSSAFSKFIGLLGGLGLLAALAKAARAISDFFDNINKKADETVQKAQAVRQAYEGLFEAAGAYDEKSRKAIVKNTEQLLQETGTSAQVGYPTIEKYTRQFKGVMPSGEYETGIRNALSYAARHGGAATPDLIDMMRGYNMNTPQQQSEFMRTVTAASEVAGMTDEDLVSAMGRAAPSARAMGWTPQETISKVAALAAGETGRNKTAMPAAVIEAMASPQNEGLKKYGIAGKTPNEILESVRKKSQGMSADDRHKMLADIYGAGAVKGVYKLMTSGAPAIVPVSEAADAAERETFKQTMEFRDAQTKAKGRGIITQTTSEAEHEAQIREIGRAEQERNAVENPIEQGFSEEAARKLYIPSTWTQNWAAEKAWAESLTDDQKKESLNRVQKRHGIKRMPNPKEPDYDYSIRDLLQQDWRDMTPQQQFESSQPKQPSQPAPTQQPQTVQEQPIEPEAMKLSLINAGQLPEFADTIIDQYKKMSRRDQQEFMATVVEGDDVKTAEKIKSFRESGKLRQGSPYKSDLVVENGVITDPHAEEHRIQELLEKYPAPEPPSQPANIIIHNHNDTYFGQTPPDAQPRSNGGL